MSTIKPKVQPIIPLRIIKPIVPKILSPRVQPIVPKILSPRVQPVKETITLPYKMGSYREGYCEGYWGKDISDASFPWPIPSYVEWKEKSEFIRRLKVLEDLASKNDQFYNYKSFGGPNPNPDNGLMTRNQRGYSPSRLEPGVLLGGREYVDINYNVCWTGGLLDRYIIKHNVGQFIKYAMENPYV